jgi:hypothetical protein
MSDMINSECHVNSSDTMKVLISSFVGGIGSG